MTDNSPFDIHNSTSQNLAGFRPQQLAVAIHTAPVAIDECHRIATHGALGRRSLVDDRELREFTIVVIGHGAVFLPYSRDFILSNKAFSALSRLGTPTNVSRPSIIVAGTALTECRSARLRPSSVVISTSR